MEIRTTEQIIGGEQNKEILVTLKEVFTWYPGDYVTFCHQCDNQVFCTHLSIDKQWQQVIAFVKADPRYTNIFNSVKTRGFVGPLRSVVSENDHVIMLDGHHRVGVAWDMSMELVPMYVGSKGTEPTDLLAADSNWWYEGHEPWVDIMGK